MNWKPISIAFALFLLIGAIAISAVGVTELYKQIAPKSCEEFKQVGYIWLPKDVSKVFLNDTILLHFSMINGKTVTVAGMVSDGKISELSCLPASAHDFEVSMSDINALELATSMKPISTFVRLWRTGSILIEPNGKENQVKLAYADQLMTNDSEPVPEFIRNIFGKFVGK